MKKIISTPLLLKDCPDSKFTGDLMSSDPLAESVKIF